MDNRGETIVVIPALEPDMRLVQLVRDLRMVMVQMQNLHIIVVDDGSTSPAAAAVFDRLATQAGNVVLHHDVNRGKGAALKTAAAYVAQRFPGSGFITADCDLQHLPNDIAHVAQVAREHPQALVLGARDFAQPQVPFKSRWGNRIMSLLFKLRTGKRIDTQTGLRAIPADLVTLLPQVTGERFDFEMNVLLLTAEKDVAVKQVAIATVYYERNRGTHFDTWRDSVRVSWTLLRFAMMSMVCALLDLGLFLLLTMLLTGTQAVVLTAATIIARLASGICNFALNKNYTFKYNGNAIVAAIGYAALFLALMALSASGVVLLAGFGVQPVLSKVLVDCTLFSVSYLVQRNVIFKARKTMKQDEVL
jgi:putative flippase GtrA